MAFSPNSVVYLLDTPLSRDNKNQLYFTSQSSQTNYFLRRIKKTFESVSYIRKTNSFRISENIDDLYNCNYVMYRNTNFSSKYFYAFIKEKQYVNENTTEVFIETDVFQTYLFDTTILKSFVVREHVSDDSLGKHTIPEGLEYGEHIISSKSTNTMLSDFGYLVAVTETEPIAGMTTISSSHLCDNIYNGLHLFFLRNTSSGRSSLQFIIDSYASAGKSDEIVYISTIPSFMFPSAIGESGATSSINYFVDKQSETFSVSKQQYSIDGYTPKNNKLYSSPYCFLYVTNNEGSSATFNYEDFTSNTCNFVIEGNISPNPTIMCCPVNYKSDSTKNYEYALSLTNYTLCAWVNDVYKNWLAQNKANLMVSTVQSLAQLVGGIASGNPVGGIGGVLNNMVQVHNASIQPDQARGNANNSNFNLSNGCKNFYFQRMTIKSEYAKIIDNFFSMYGYKVNEVKVPNLHTRQNWNYIQTNDINIIGNMSNDELEKLKSIYNNGVTLWHNPNNFCDYSKENGVID